MFSPNFVKHNAILRSDFFTKSTYTTSNEHRRIIIIQFKICDMEVLHFTSYFKCIYWWYWFDWYRKPFIQLLTRYLLCLNASFYWKDKIEFPFNFVFLTECYTESLISIFRVKTLSYTCRSWITACFSQLTGRKHHMYF